MAYLIAILVTLALLIGFLFLTAFERARGMRVLGGVRNTLDRRVGRGAFVMKHVDWNAFIRHVIQAAAARIAHDVAQVTLVAVRVIERLLTRIVRTLRERDSKTPPTPRTDGLRATLVYFRKNLRTRFQHRSNTQKEGE